MIQTKSKFDDYQLGVFLICAMLGIGMLQAPQFRTIEAGSEGWLVAIMQGVICILGAALICWALDFYDGLGFVSTCENLFGKKFGIILILPVVIQTLFAAIIELRIFGITTKVFLLKDAPIQAIILPFLGLILLLARSGFEKIMRFFQVIVPFLMISIIGLVLLSLPNAQYSNMLPVFAREPSDYLKSAANSVFAFSGFQLILIIYPFLKNKKFKDTFKTSAKSIGIVTAIYSATTALCIAKLGVGETKWLIYPNVSLVRSAYIPGGFIERLEGILMSVWVVFSYSTVVAMVFAAAVIIADIIKQREIKHLVAIFMPIIYCLSTLAPSMLEVLEISNAGSKALMPYCIIILPVLIIIFGIIKRKKEVKYGEA